MLTKGDILDDRYLIDGLIGTGGTSKVFRAFDMNAGKGERAVKEIHGSSDEIEEKIAESVLMAKLSSSNTKFNFIPNIIHRVRKDDALFIVMDYINGVDMSEQLSPQNPVPCQKVIEYARDICTFMSFMHENNYLFSDMKPENIMILKNDDNNQKNNEFSSLKFVDFGATINIGEETIAFTPSYAAPEQFLGQFESILPDKRTDIFNIGATIFHIATGYAPENVFKGEGDEAGDIRPSAERFIFPAKSNISPGLKRIILRCVADDREKRYSSCSEVISDLDKLSERKHVIASSVLMGISLLMLLIGIFTSVKCVSEKNKFYNSYMKIAESSFFPSERTENCVYAIKMKPENTEGYLKLIETFTYDRDIDDGTDDMYFTDDEKRILMEVVASNQRYLTESKSYGRIEYEIGKLIWYYGTEDDGVKSFEETEKTKMRSALSYFEAAVSSRHENSLTEDEYRLAEIYYDIADFCSNYQKRIENGDKNEPVSLSDIRFLTEMIRKNAPNDYVRLETYYTVLGLIGDSLNYYEEDVTDEQLLEFYEQIYDYSLECDFSQIPVSDRDLGNRVVEKCILCINLIS